MNLKLFSELAVVIVALLQLSFLILEMFFWESPKALKAFQISPELAKETVRFGSNIGLYNGFLVAGLVWGLLSNEGDFFIKVFFLSCIVVAGVFGAVTVNRSILLFQAIPAVIALVLVFLAR